MRRGLRLVDWFPEPLRLLFGGGAPLVTDPRYVVKGASDDRLVRGIRSVDVVTGQVSPDTVKAGI